MKCIHLISFKLVPRILESPKLITLDNRRKDMTFMHIICISSNTLPMYAFYDNLNNPLDLISEFHFQEHMRLHHHLSYQHLRTQISWSQTAFLSLMSNEKITLPIFNLMPTSSTLFSFKSICLLFHKTQDTIVKMFSLIHKWTSSVNILHIHSKTLC